MRSTPLKSLIYRNMLTSSLISILVIETALLLLYFGINIYTTARNTDILLTKAEENLHHIAAVEATKIDLQLKEISDFAQLLQQENQAFFTDPDRFPLTGQRPEFAVAGNGVFYQKNNLGGSSLYYSAATKITERELNKARMSVAFDPLYRFIVDSNPTIVASYFNSHDDMNRLYPFIEEVYKQFEPAMEMSDFNFYYLGDLAHNPAKKPVWTGAYLDPAGQGWMVSCVVPVYNGDFLEGVTGLDVTIDKFVSNILNLNLPWEASGFLVDEQGMILAMPEKVEKVLGLTELKRHVYKDTIQEETLKPEQYNILKNDNEQLAGLFQAALKSNTPVFEAGDQKNQSFFVQAQVPETGWRLLVMVDKDILFAPINKLKQLSRKIGYFAIGLMLLFYALFFIYLQRKSASLSERVASPIMNLVQVTSWLRKGQKIKRAEPSGLQEIDTLADDFHQMADELEKNTGQLQETNLRLESELAERLAAEKELEKHRDHLDELVHERTGQLNLSNDKLKQEIGERKKSEAELELKQKQLVAMFDAVSEVVYVVDPKTHEILFLNKVGREVFSDDAVGKKCYQALQNLDRPCSFCTNDRLFGPEAAPLVDWEFHNKNVDKWFRCVDQAIDWPDGRRVRIEMATDITDRKLAEEQKSKLEEQFRQAQKMEAIGRLAGGVAHDFNNILTGINGYAELILCSLSPGDDLFNEITEIKKSGERAAKLTQQLLAYSRKQVIAPKIVDLNKILIENQMMLTRIIGENIDFRFTPLSEKVLISADRGQFEQIMMNLAINARDAISDEGGKLIIELNKVEFDEQNSQIHLLSSPGKYVEIVVTDTGCGMDKQTVSQIFEPFFTTKPKGKGTGLGLSTVYGIIKQNGGSINVSSEVGSGATFRIYFPMVAEQKTESARRTDKPIPKGKETVLVAEDEEMVLMLTKKILQQQGYHVLDALNGDQAFDICQNHAGKIDLLLTDVIMPDTNGKQLSEKIKKARPGIRVIFMSGYTEDTIDHHGILDEGVHFIQKPFSMKQLVNKVYKVLDNGEPGSEQIR